MKRRVNLFLVKGDRCVLYIVVSFTEPCVSWQSIMKIPQTGGLTHKKLFSLSYGGWRSKFKVLVGLLSPEAPLLSLHMATFLLCHTTCVWVWFITYTQQSSCFIRVHIPLISSNFNYHFKGSISKHSNIGGLSLLWTGSPITIILKPEMCNWSDVKKYSTWQ